MHGMALNPWSIHIPHVILCIYQLYQTSPYLHNFAFPLPSSHATFCSSHSSHCFSVQLELISLFTTPSKTTVGVTCTPCRRLCFVCSFTKSVTPFPVFKPPSLSGLSLISNNPYTSFSLTPTLPAILASLLYVSFLVSFTTLASKKSFCCSKSFSLKS